MLSHHSSKFMLFQKLPALAAYRFNLHLLFDELDVLNFSLTLFLLCLFHLMLDMVSIRLQFLHILLICLWLNLFCSFFLLRKLTIELVNFLADHDLFLSVLFIFEGFLSFRFLDALLVPLIKLLWSEILPWIRRVVSRCDCAIECFLNSLLQLFSWQFAFFVLQLAS